jgi:hypothetical protein
MTSSVAQFHPVNSRQGLVKVQLRSLRRLSSLTARGHILLQALRNGSYALLVIVILMGLAVTRGGSPKVRKSHLTIRIYMANRMDLRLADWCDAMTREGELFAVLYLALDGMTQVRMRPASVIDDVSNCTYDAFARYSIIAYENSTFQ